MKKSKEFYLEQLLTPWVGLADDDVAIVKYRAINPNDEAAMKSIISSDLGPYLAVQTAERRTDIRDALRNSLLANDVDFGRLFDSLLPPFGPPDDPHDLFKWIWDVFFGPSTEPAS